MTLTSRIRAPRFRRVGFAFLAGLHLAVVAAVPAADAVLEAEADRAVHVEAPGDPRCELHQDHLFCQLCRTVGVRALLLPHAARHSVLAPHVRLSRVPAEAPTPPGVSLLGILGPRAPPLA